MKTIGGMADGTDGMMIGIEIANGIATAIDIDKGTWTTFTKRELGVGRPGGEELYTEKMPM